MNRYSHPLQQRLYRAPSRQANVLDRHNNVEMRISAEPKR